MKTIQTSEQTKSLLAKLKQKYDAKQVFINPDSPKLHQDSELTSLMSEIFEALGRDIQKHFKVKAKGSAKGFVIHNLKVLVTYETDGTGYAGYHDYESEQCYELGSYYL